MSTGQSDKLAALKTLVAEYQSRKPMLGYYGEGIEVQPDQLAALIEAAEEADRLRHEKAALPFWEHDFPNLLKLVDEQNGEIDRLRGELTRFAAEQLRRYEAVVEAARQIGGCVDCWNADDSFLRLSQALVELDAP